MAYKHMNKPMISSKSNPLLNPKYPANGSDILGENAKNMMTTHMRMLKIKVGMVDLLYLTLFTTKAIKAIASRIIMN